MKESSEVFKKVIDVEGPKFTSSETNIQISKLYNWRKGKTGSEYTMNPIEQIIALTRCSGNKDLVKFLCNSVGGYYVENPDKVISELQLLEKINKVMRRFSMTIDTITKSVADDGRITKDEADEIEIEWNKLKSVGQTLVDCAKAGRYDGDNR